VPGVSRAEGGEVSDVAPIDAVVDLGVEVTQVPFMEFGGRPEGPLFFGHEGREHGDLLLVAVCESNQVFPVAVILAEGGIVVHVDRAAPVEAVADRLTEVEAALSVMVALNHNHIHWGDLGEFFQGTGDDVDSRREGFLPAAIFILRSSTSSFAAQTVHVEEVIAEREEDPVDLILGSLADEFPAGILEESAGDGAVIIFVASLSAPSQLADVKIGDADLVEVSLAGGSLNLDWCRFVLADQFLEVSGEFGGLIAAFALLEEGFDLEEGFHKDSTFTVADAHFPFVDEVAGDLPVFQINFAGGEELFEAGDGGRDGRSFTGAVGAIEAGLLGFGSLVLDNALALIERGSDLADRCDLEVKFFGDFGIRESFGEEFRDLF